MVTIDGHLEKGRKRAVHAAALGLVFISDCRGITQTVGEKERAHGEQRHGSLA